MSEAVVGPRSTGLAGLHGHMSEKVDIHCRVAITYSRMLGEL